MKDTILEMKDIVKDKDEAADSIPPESVTLPDSTVADSIPPESITLPDSTLTVDSTVPVKKTGTVGTLIECKTSECKRSFIKKGNRHEFCDECQEEKHGPGYKKRVRNRTKKRRYKRNKDGLVTDKKGWQKPNICEQDGCEDVFIPEDPRQKYCPEHRTDTARSKRYSIKKNKDIVERKGIDIDEMINELVPHSSRKKVYKIAAKLVLKNPQVVYSQIIKKHPMNISDAMFYQFRKKVNNYLAVPNNLRKEIVERREPEVEKRAYTKKKCIYTTVYEREVSGSLSEEAKDLLLDFIATLNSNGVAKFELIEITYPTSIIEVREIK